LTSFVAGIATSIIASKIIIKDGKKNRKNGMWNVKRNANVIIICRFVVVVGRLTISILQSIFDLSMFSVIKFFVLMMFLIVYLHYLFSLLAGATEEGNDLSLFYGDVDELTTITDSRKFLPSDLYGKLVRDCVVFCVDIVLVRKTSDNKQECLLVKRSSEPAKGLWWWPGGRMLKGETFFDAAKRKAQQETGLDDVTCIQVLGIWNT
jgi:hypothetical protein